VPSPDPVVPNPRSRPGEPRPAGAGAGARSAAPQQFKVRLDSLSELRARLADMFVGREQEIDAIIASLISGEPAILVGPPGTAKTAMVETLAKLTNARYFYYLLTRFTEPDELLGPLDIRALREGVYARVTAGRLPEAEIAFLDEVFKASSAIRNTLLDIILYRRFLNNGTHVKLPLLTLYTASNEVSTDAEDQAFYDRLAIRCFVKPVEAPLWEELLVKGVRLATETLDLKPILAVEHVKEYKKAVDARASEMLADPNLRAKIVGALAELRGRNLELSDRRKVKLVIVAAAYSVLNAESKPTVNSLADALEVVAVHMEEDKKKVEEVIISQKLRTYDVMKLAALKEELRRVYEEVKSRGDDISALDRDIELLRMLYIRAAGELESLLRHRHGGRIPREARELYAVAAEVGRFLEERLRALSARRLPDAS
jgi:MoxR-like ATPase